MNYYRRYVGDYLRDTSRLSMLEHGAYNLLLDYYYAEERPISADLDEVYRMVRAILPEERRAVVKVLGLFFDRGEDGYRHKRVEHEIEVSRKARDNGGKGGRPRTGTVTGDKTGSETDLLTGAGGGSGHPPTTNHQPPAYQPPKNGKDIVGQGPDIAAPKRNGHDIGKAQALRADAVSLLEFLNAKAGRNYKPVPANVDLIVARLRDGATVEDCRAVIAKKCREWLGDATMNEYLRPATLFNRTKFAQYQGELAPVGSA